jgi:hypothetical protein
MNHGIIPTRGNPSLSTSILRPLFWFVKADFQKHFCTAFLLLPISVLRNKPYACQRQSFHSAASHSAATIQFV